jgi:hypothetical protein
MQTSNVDTGIQRNAPERQHEPGRTATEAEDGRQTVNPAQPEEARQPSHAEGDQPAKPR